jgi:hypothetical protein
MNTNAAGIADVFGLPVDTAIAFSNHKNIYKRGLEKRQKKLYKKLAFLSQFLERGEKILYVTEGCSPFTVLEQLFTGAILYSLKRCMFVFTDRRIFHIPTKPNLAYRSSIAQILYADCAEISIRRGKLAAKYKSGKIEKFPAISGKARRKITELLKHISFAGETSPILERAHLCPRCTKPMLNGYYVCPHCALKFKSRKEARRVSVIYPGGGYFYTRHYVLGILDALGESALLFLLVTALVNLICGDSAALGAVIVTAVLLAFEKVITIMHTDKFIEEFVVIDSGIKAQPGFTPAAAQ